MRTNHRTTLRSRSGRSHLGSQNQIHQRQTHQSRFHLGVRPNSVVKARGLHSASPGTNQTPLSDPSISIDVIATSPLVSIVAPGSSQIVNMKADDSLCGSINCLSPRSPAGMDQTWTVAVATTAPISTACLTSAVATSSDCLRRDAGCHDVIHAFASVPGSLARVLTFQQVRPEVAGAQSVIRASVAKIVLLMKPASDPSGLFSRSRWDANANVLDTTRLGETRLEIQGVVANHRHGRSDDAVGQFFVTRSSEWSTKNMISPAAA